MRRYINNSCSIIIAFALFFLVNLSGTLAIAKEQKSSATAVENGAAQSKKKGTDELSKQSSEKDKDSALKKFWQKLDIYGDFRLRYQNTANQDGQPMSNLGVLRFRLGFKYPINDLIEVGARMTTGPQDNPRTSDVTINDFGHDFSIKLNRAYLAFKYKELFFTGGKFKNPFLYTELVWDNDVAPQGVAGSFTFPTLGIFTPKVTGMFFIVDRIMGGPSSYMGGGQAEFKFDLPKDLCLILAGAYYDYTIRSLAHAANDIRTNRVNAAGTAYLSDYDMADAILKFKYSGIGERWPITLIGDYVHNFGAPASLNNGFEVDLFFGRNEEKGDFRAMYGYSMAQTDAVLAAFSNDNTTIATNYKQHTVAFDYVVLKNTFLNATWYLYRRDKLGNTPTTDSDQYVSRVRLNVMVKW